MRASSRSRGLVLGRFLWVVMAVVLALPVAGGGAYGETRRETSAAASGRGAAAATPVTPLAGESLEHPEPADRWRPRRGGRSAAAVSAPVPPSTPLSTACLVRDADGLPVSVPLTGQQALPLSRSGELPVQHRVFRC